jgi:hypothetical protein
MPVWGMVASNADLGITMSEWVISWAGIAAMLAQSGRDEAASASSQK